MWHSHCSAKKEKNRIVLDVVSVKHPRFTKALIAF